MRFRVRNSFTLTLPHVQKPFWNAAIAATSEMLWQPVDGDLLEHHRDLPGVRAHGQRTTWCSIVTFDSRKPVADQFSFNPSKSSEPEIKRRKKKRKKDAPDVEAEALLTKKIRLAPDCLQRVKLKQWLGAARWVYNKVIAHIQAKPKEASLAPLRKLYVHNAAYNDSNRWMLQIPYDIRDGALRDALVAHKNARTLAKEKGIRSVIKYRSKKAQSESVYLCARNVKRLTDNEIEPYESFKIGRIKTKEELPGKFDHDLRLQRNALGEFYLLVPVPTPPKPEPRNEPNKRIIAVDPGTRVFMTGYEPSGSVIEVGGADMGRVERLCAHLDALQSRIAKERNIKTKWRMRRAAARMRCKIRNLVDDVHKKFAHFLATTYDLVLLPKFEASTMVRRASRRINSKAVRAMLTWAHYRFRQRLLNRCRRANCSVAVVTEEYTSKTCGKCGEIHDKLGPNKRFVCPTCAHDVDRDRNAARNILLKNGDKVDFLVERHL